MNSTDRMKLIDDLNSCFCKMKIVLLLEQAYKVLGEDNIVIFADNYEYNMLLKDKLIEMLKKL